VRKLTAIFLLLVFCNNLFYYGYFSISLIRSKIAAALALAKIDPAASTNLLRVAVGRLQKDESNEVWFNNKLYDVVDRERTNDTTFVYLLRDEDEQTLVSGNQRYWEAEAGDIFGKDNNMTPLKMTPAVSDNELWISRPLEFLKRQGLNRPFPFVHPDRLPANETGRPHPPPRQGSTYDPICLRS